VHDARVPPLQQAAGLGRVNALGLLLRAKADPGVPGCLHAAVLSRVAGAVQRLLAAGVAANALDNDGNAALDLAVRQLDGGDAVRMLLRAKALVDALDQGGRTPLMQAILSNSYTDAYNDVIASLLAAKSSVNRAYRNETPLSIALTMARDASGLLVAAKASVDAHVPLPGGGPLVCYMSRRSSATPLTRLLRLKALVDQPDGNGWTALMFAAASGNEVVTRSLLSARAACAAQTTRPHQWEKRQVPAGATPLAIAQLTRHASVAALIRAHDTASAPDNAHEDAGSAHRKRPCP
jgi:ankyrin repeat protein